MRAESLPSCLTLCDPRTLARQAPLSVGFSWQESWSGLPCPPPGRLPHPGIEAASPTSSVSAGGFFTTGPTWEAHVEWIDLLLSIHPSIDGHLVCSHILPLTNNNNRTRVLMFYSGLSFFLGYVSRSYMVGSCGHPAFSHWETLRLSSQVAKTSYVPPAAGENSRFFYILPNACFWLFSLLATHQNVDPEILIFKTEGAWDDHTKWVILWYHFYVES